MLRDWVSEGWRGGGFLRGGFSRSNSGRLYGGAGVGVCVWTFCTYKTMLEVSNIPYSTTTTPAFNIERTL